MAIKVGVLKLKGPDKNSIVRIPLGADGITAPDIIPLTDKACSLTTITRVIQYLTEHTAVDQRAAETFDRELQEQSEEIIFEMMLAANFLDIEELTHLMCKKVADDIKKCKTPDDIRDRY